MTQTSQAESAAVDTAASVLTVVRDSGQAVFGASQPAKLPIGAIVASQATAQHQESTEVGASIGVWESSPGVFRRHLKNREFSHIISGWCIFTPDGGGPVELRAGDAVLFPANCEGVWDIRETLRKTYVLF
ncbi:cupin domain-containing protein [Massilia sp.]|uniref:cupin domain-containing protein n=1 Tax=Massilia sp. TaxID=1882437 RepID=UPI00352E443B